MRKYIRNLIRYEAKQEKTKASSYIKVMFDTIQRKKYGEERRKRNQARGTHKAKLWPFRDALLSSR